MKMVKLVEKDFCWNFPKIPPPPRIHPPKYAAESGFLKSWKINGRKLQIAHLSKGKSSEPNLHEDMFQPLIFRGVGLGC